MISIQDLQINNFQNPDEMVQMHKLAYKQENSSLINLDNSKSAIYTYEVKKPKVGLPQTKEIYPVVIIYANKLKTGDAEERAYIMNTINNLCTRNSKEAIAFSDENITNALFSIIDEDISKLKKPTRRQLRLRKDFNANKKLSKNQKTLAFSYSEYEIAEQNKLLAFYTISSIQNLMYKVITKKTGLKPDIYSNKVIEKIIDEAKNNKDGNMRAAAIGTLHVIAKPEYNQDFKIIFQSALSDKEQIVRDTAQEALLYIE